MYKYNESSNPNAQELSRIAAERTASIIFSAYGGTRPDYAARQAALDPDNCINAQAALLVFRLCTEGGSVNAFMAKKLVDIDEA